MPRKLMHNNKYYPTRIFYINAGVNVKSNVNPTLLSEYAADAT